MAHKTTTTTTTPTTNCEITFVAIAKIKVKRTESRLIVVSQIKIVHTIEYIILGRRREESTSQNRQIDGEQLI